MTETRKQDQIIATNSNRNGVGIDTLYFWDEQLVLKADGGYSLRTYAGGAMQHPPSHQILTRNEAITWIAMDARDPMTGYGYTVEQANIMVDGGDAGKGYRTHDDFGYPA